MLTKYSKGDYAIFEKKAREHEGLARIALKENSFDACVSCACLGLINYMDAISVNFFGTDNKSRSHEHAPYILLDRLNKAGKSNFKDIAHIISDILKLKSLASYEGRLISGKDAKRAVLVLNKLIDYYDKNIDRLVDKF